MKCALVTGGSRGIGKAVSEGLAEDGFHVLVNYVSNQNAAEDTVNKIKEGGGSAEAIKFDAGSKESIENALKGWKEKNPEEIIYVLVNNAGIRKDGLMMWMKDSDWHDVMNITLNGFFYTTKFVLDDMLKAKHGRVINMVSVSGMMGVPGQANYSAAKSAIIGATRSLSKEVARRNITVNAVAPGFIETDMTADLDEKELKKMIPVRRLGKPEEVADLVRFLASEKSSYITGETISITGGIGN